MPNFDLHAEVALPAADGLHNVTGQTWRTNYVNAWMEHPDLSTAANVTAGMTAVLAAASGPANANVRAGHGAYHHLFPAAPSGVYDHDAVAADQGITAVAAIYGSAPEFICADRPEARSKFRPERSLFDCSVASNLRLLQHGTSEGSGSATLIPQVRRAMSGLRIPYYGVPQRRKTFIFFQEFSDINQNDALLEGVSLMHPLTNVGDRSRATVGVYPAQKERVPELLPATRQINESITAMGAGYGGGLLTLSNLRALQSAMQMGRLGR